ncbi:MAG: bifunctional diaminohydroxyphosphoribosylaminopyrimidine deaminase/5-amino-6-(5-phosphoribosylamino)uracil reductase RibD [Cohaesibacteraceae bacterium]
MPATKDSVTELDRRFLAAAVRLGASRLGMTWPNPSVGCLIVKDGIVVSQGITGAGGRPHGARLALDRAGAAARGATAYVSLEPCNHHGKTPPCTEALIASGIAKVVIALGDTDPRVCGSGINRLQENGITVVVEPDKAIRQAALKAHRGHLMRIAQGRPFVTLKMALSADSGIGVEGQGQVAITSEASNRMPHGVRSRFDAIGIGSGTLRADDPLLSVRRPGLSHRSPVAVLFGGSGFDATKLVNTRPAEELIHLPGHDLQAGLQTLGEHGLTSLLVEGGARLAKAFLEAHLVDELILLKGEPVLGSKAIRPFPSDPFDDLKAADLDGWKVTARRRIGPDRLMRLAPPTNP